MPLCNKNRIAQITARNRQHKGTTGARYTGVMPLYACPPYNFYNK